MTQRQTSGDDVVDLGTATPSTSTPWLKFDRSGDTITAYYSDDGSTWTEIGTSDPITGFSADIQVGLMVASGDDSTADTATFGNILMYYTPLPGVVDYTYNQSGNFSRLSTMTYPDGRVLHYGYSSGLDSNISRLSYIADDNGSGGVGLILRTIATSATTRL